MAIDQLFSNLTNSPAAKGALGGAASGALVSLLMNKKARKKLGKGAAQLGGMAALAGVGYYAYRKWQGSKTPGTVEPISKQPDAALPLALKGPAAPAVSDSVGMKMILAMIAAACADGSIDTEESELLFEAIESAPLTPSEKAQLTAALNAPPTIESIATDLPSPGPEVAAEIYGAALTAIQLDTPAEHFFLRRLAAALKLEPDLVSAIHEQMA